jgi:hypothetical protein
MCLFCFALRASLYYLSSLNNCFFCFSEKNKNKKKEENKKFKGFTFYWTKKEKGYKRRLGVLRLSFSEKNPEGGG